MFTPKTFSFRRLQFIVWAWLIFSALPVHASPYGPPVADRELERRLSRNQTYRTQPGDTLRGLARLLYGHETWWRKLRSQNPKLKSHGPDDRIARGTQLSYRAPEVGDEYVVQKNDWLIRIVTWKYGSTEQWEQVFRKNAAQISNPNLIHPGDRLALRLDGTVENKTTGQRLVEGLGPDTERELAAARAARELAAKAPEEPPFWSFQSPYFMGGMMAAAALLLLTPLGWLLQRVRESRPAPAHREEPVFAEEEEVSHAARDDQGYPHTFKRRPLEDYEIDKGLVNYRDDEIDRRPGYHSIVPKKLKKYLLRKRKGSK